MAIRYFHFLQPMPGLFFLSIIALFTACQSNVNRKTFTRNDSDRVFDWAADNMMRMRKDGSAVKNPGVYNMYVYIAKLTMPRLPPYIDKLYDSIDSNFYNKLDHLLDSGNGKMQFKYIDTTGLEYSESEANDMILSGRYNYYMHLNNYIFIKRSNEEMQSHMNIHPKPSSTIMEMSSYSYQEMEDIFGNRFNKTRLIIKVLVINYWFIKCLPCRVEIPELNNLVKQYAKDTNVIFLGVAPDSKTDLQIALRQFNFEYNIIPNSGQEIKRLNIEEFPTHVVIGKNGKIAFSCAESGERAVNWIRKTIDSCVAAK